MSDDLKSYTIIVKYSVPHARSREDALYQFETGDGGCYLDTVIGCVETDSRGDQHI